MGLKAEVGDDAWQLFNEWSRPAGITISVKTAPARSPEQFSLAWRAIEQAGNAAKGLSHRRTSSRVRIPLSNAAACNINEAR